MAQTRQQRDPPKIGEVWVSNGKAYRFVGGDPGDTNNWVTHALEAGDIVVSNNKRFTYSGGDPTEFASFKRIGEPEPAQETGISSESYRWEDVAPTLSPQQRLGWGREFLANLSAGLTLPAERRLRGISAEQQNEERAPFKDLMSPKLLGAGAGGLAAGYALAPLAAGSGLLRTLGILGTEGALTGAVAGHNFAPPGARREGAMGGALLGGPGGIIAGGLAGAASSGRGAVRHITGKSAASEVPAMAAEELGGLRHGGSFADLATPGGGTLAEVHPYASAYGARSLRLNPKSAFEITDPAMPGSVVNRLEQQAAQMADDAFARLGATGHQGTQRRLAQLSAERSSRVGEAYDMFRYGDVPIGPHGKGGTLRRDKVITDPEILKEVDGLKRHPRGRRVLRDLEAEYRARLNLPADAPVPRTNGFVEELQRMAGLSGGVDPSGFLKGRQTRLIELMSDRLPGYAEARRLSAILGDRTADAIKQAARGWKNRSVDDITWMLQQLDPEQQQWFFISALDDMQESFATRLGQDSKTAFKVFRDKSRQLSAMFGDNNVDEFLTTMRQAEGKYLAGVDAARAHRPGSVESADPKLILLTQLGYALNRMFGAAARTGLQGAARSGAARGRFAEETAKLFYMTPQAQALRALDDAVPLAQLLRLRQARANVGAAYGGGILGPDVIQNR